MLYPKKGDGRAGCLLIVSTASFKESMEPVCVIWCNRMISQSLGIVTAHTTPPQSLTKMRALKEKHLASQRGSVSDCYEPFIYLLPAESLTVF